MITNPKLHADRFRILVVLSALVALALVVSACGDDDGGTTSPSATESISSAPPEEPAADGEPAGDAPASEPVEQAAVNIIEFDYDPDPVLLKTGGTVEFTNSDAARHTATGDDKDLFDTGDLGKGDAKSVTFDEPGTYKYICLFHPFMTGTVEVVE